MTTFEKQAHAKTAALVTGGSRGIGAEAVRSLAAEGAAVAFTYVSSEATAHELVKSSRAEAVLRRLFEPTAVLK